MMGLQWWKHSSEQLLRAPALLRPWLTAQGSLSELCRNTAPGAFTVTKVFAGTVPLLEDEAVNFQAVVTKASSVQAWGRQVILSLHQQPVIIARTVVPEQTWHKEQHWLQALGDESLGDHLFLYDKWLRGPIEYAYGNVEPYFDKKLIDRFLQLKACWARRSVFQCGDRELLVMEAFLPELLPFLENTNFCHPC